MKFCYANNAPFFLCLCAFGFALLLLLIFVFVIVFVFVVVVLSVSPTRRTSVALKGTMQNECDWMNWRGDRHCDGDSDWGWDSDCDCDGGAAITSERETQTKRNKTRSPSQGKAKQGKAWQSNGAAAAQQQRSQFAYNSQWAQFALLCCTRTSRRLPSKAYFCQVVTLYSYLDNSVYTWGTVLWEYVNKVMPDKI